MTFLLIGDDMARPLWFVHLLKKTFPNTILIAKLTKIPFIGKIIDLLMFEDDNLIFLPRDRVIQVNKQVDQLTNIVLPSQVIEYFIQKANYHWIMNFCICRDSMQCKDYPISMGCLFLGESVLQINPQLGRQVNKEEALKHLKLCQEKGLVHVIGRNKLDSQWLNAKPGNTLLTICNCCPCCCLYRIIPHLKSSISSKMQRMPGVKVQVGNKCIGCGICTKDVCFVNAIRLIDKRAIISNECRGCGRCVDMCPQNAIELTVENEVYVKKTIERINKSVDVT